MMRHAALLLLVLGQSYALKFGGKKPEADVVEVPPAWEPYLEMAMAHWKYAAAFLAVVILLLPKKKVAWLPFRRGRARRRPEAERPSPSPPARSLDPQAF